jgi:hypothetical protein
LESGSAIGDGQARGGICEGEGEGGVTTKPEYLDEFVLRARRAGFTCAFVNVDCVVDGRERDFLVVPERIADRFQEQFPTAQRLSLEGLQRWIEDKVKAGRETENQTEEAP